MADIFDSIQFSDKDYTDVVMKNPQALWFQRAANNPVRTEDNKSVFTLTIEQEGKHLVIPTVRLDEQSGELYEMKPKEAIEYSLKAKDYITADSAAEATFISKGFSSFQGKKANGEY